jgi:broad specificity phosphatase PhoE
MVTDIFLIRHGQTNANVDEYYMGWSDEDLNELGYHQAHCLSSRLAAQPIASIYTSPLKRAHTTASIIAEPHQLKVEALPDFIEIQLGEWQGMRREEIKRKWPKLWQQSRIDPSGLRLPNGESYNELTERAIRGFNMASQANQGKQIVIVTHDAIIRVLVAHVLRVSNSIYRRLEIENASLSLVRIIDHPKLLKLNETLHLQCKNILRHAETSS